MAGEVGFLGVREVDEALRGIADEAQSIVVDADGLEGVKTGALARSELVTEVFSAVD